MEKNENAEPRRLNLNLSTKAYSELVDLARVNNSSVTATIRLALGLAGITLREREKGNKLMVVGPAGKPIRELTLHS